MAKTEDKFPVLLVGLLILYPLLALGGRRKDIDITCNIGTYHADEATRPVTTTPHYDLAVFVIFKNEADIMEEWIEHHTWQVPFFTVLSIVACPPWSLNLG
jgi:hypothetical protein